MHSGVTVCISFTWRVGTKFTVPSIMLPFVKPLQVFRSNSRICSLYTCPSYNIYIYIYIYALYIRAFKVVKVDCFNSTIWTLEPLRQKVFQFRNLYLDYPLVWDVTGKDSWKQSHSLKMSLPWCNNETRYIGIIAVLWSTTTTAHCETILHYFTVALLLLFSDEPWSWYKHFANRKLEYNIFIGILEFWKLLEHNMFKCIFIISLLLLTFCINYLNATLCLCLWVATMHVCASWSLGQVTLNFDIVTLIWHFDMIYFYSFQEVKMCL